MSDKVIILGGGVAGLSAAHELSERGFQVEIFEKQVEIPGGKARSVPVPNTATPGRRALPGEHGFRFFPGFYRHIVDTMARIPYPGNKNGVADNLVDTHTIMIARFDKDPIVMLDEFPTTLDELIFTIKSIFKANTDLTENDIVFFAERIWQLMTSCSERRLAEYEGMGWWEYLEADRHSEAYRSLFVLGLTRSLVAAKAEEASTKTVGDIFLQLVFNMLDPFVETDRLLNGPTNDVWINPWLEYLTTQKGVKYHFGHETTKLHTDGTVITGVDLKKADGTTFTITEKAIYLCAMPVERAATLLSKEILAIDSSLYTLPLLANDVNWMNGIQFYLNEYTPINQGHVIYSDTSWALTSVSQKQFWKNVDLSQFGDGTVKDVLSVDISDWFTKGLNGKQANECTKEEVKNEVWAQLKKSLNVNGNIVLKDEMLVNWYLDSDIKFTPFEVASNEEPLLVNKVNTWTLRPEAYTRIPNLFLAGDYVRTFTDLATMEGANEAARRAVNAILDSTKYSGSLCKIWKLHEPVIFAPLRWHDANRFQKGLPWQSHIPWYFKIPVLCIKLFIKVFKFIAKLFKKKK